MSAVELRQAASLLRERANAASPGGGDCRGFDKADAAYAATVLPGVGLALADWLDEVWAWVEEGVGMVPGGNIGDAWIGVVSKAKTVARLINGSEC